MGIDQAGFDGGGFNRPKGRNRANTDPPPGVNTDTPAQWAARFAPRTRRVSRPAVAVSPDGREYEIDPGTGRWLR